MRKVAAFSLMFLASCTVGPDYKHPEAALPANFTGAAADGITSDAIDVGWWKSFKDGQLIALVGDGFAQNKSVSQAVARVKEARAQRVEAAMELFPTVLLEGGYRRRLAGPSIVPGLDRNLRETDIHTAAIDVSWELDLFGRLRRGKEASEAEEEATFADLDDALRTVAAEIARNYFQLRGEQKALEVARENAKIQEETVRLTEALSEGGRATGLETSRAKAQLQTTLATIPTLEANERTLVYRLSVLTGRQPQELLEPLKEIKPVPRYEGPVKIGSPADLLRRRPDVRGVERRLAAANARIGVATADLFPRVTFLGNLGVEGPTFSSLFDSGAETYDVGPSIQWAAFDIGRVRSRIKAADARTEAALASYESTVLTALEELEASLVRFDKERRRSALLNQALEDSRRASTLAKTQYNEGLIDFLTLLDAERETLRAESDATSSETSVATNLVAVYKALGGGWEAPAVPE